MDVGGIGSWADRRGRWKNRRTTVEMDCQICGKQLYGQVRLNYRFGTTCQPCDWAATRMERALLLSSGPSAQDICAGAIPEILHTTNDLDFISLAAEYFAVIMDKQFPEPKRRVLK